MIFAKDDDDNNNNDVKRLVVFSKGDNVNHKHYIKSAIENNFDNHRKSLTLLMKSMDDNIEYMKEYEDENYALMKIHNQFRKDVSMIPQLWERNEDFLRLLLSTKDLDIVIGISETSTISTFETNFKNTNTINETNNKLSSYDSLENILLHLHRDWSNDDCITAHISLILDKVDQAFHSFQKKQKNDCKVLIPGAGLGRIGIELASRGYKVEMNECSPTMITAINNMMNDILTNDNEYRYYPYLHATLNDCWDYATRNLPVVFPPSNIDRLKQWIKDEAQNNNLSLQFGDFVSSYKIYEKKCYFDIIVTSFFMDTGSILEYLDVIKFILKPQGIWINFGPLHYHSASTIKYSYNQLLQIITLLGFDIVSQSIHEGPYGCNKDINMKPDYYIVPFDVFQLTESTSKIDTTNDNDDIINWKSQNFSLV